MKQVVRHFLSLGALLILSASALAQSTATLSGIVTDPSGAVVPNAEVNVTSLATGVDRVTSTNTDGLYSFPALQPGDYKLQARSPGFAVYTV